MSQNHKISGNVPAENVEAYMESEDTFKVLDVLATGFRHDGCFEAKMFVDLETHKWLNLYADEKGVGMAETLRRAAQALRREERT